MRSGRCRWRNWRCTGRLPAAATSAGSARRKRARGDRNICVGVRCGFITCGRQSKMAFRHPSGWLLTASPRRRPRQPFRRTTFPRSSAARRETTGRAAPAVPPQVPWWQPLLNALTALPAPPRAPHLPRDEFVAARDQQAAGTAAGEAREPWRPIADRLDRQREHLAGMEGHLRRLVELQAQRADATAVYAPPA